MSKNILLVGLLTFGFHGFMWGANAAQREVIYDLHDLGKDFSSIPMITENIDMFVGIFEMNIEINENKLKNAKELMNSALINSVKNIGAAWFASALVAGASMIVINKSDNNDMVLVCAMPLNLGLYGVRIFSYFHSVMKIYEAFKVKDTLQKSIALDMEILGKLKAVKEAEIIKQRKH